MNKVNKARKHTSPILQALLDEVSPAEMMQTKVKMQLAARIEDLMIEKGWNKSQFAEKVGKHPSEITKWLSGTHNLTVDVLAVIACALDVDVVTLFSNKQVPSSQKMSCVVTSKVDQQLIKISTPQLGYNHKSGKIINSSSFLFNYLPSSPYLA
jgi:transcriptional regulator with XRE-family HTH domain